MIIFSSDGNPNKYNPNQGPGNGFDQASLNAAIAQANIIKGYGTRIITLGIGSDVVPANLQAISSADAYYSVANFGELATALQGLATQLCGGTITVTKIIDADGSLQTTGDQTNGGLGWTFNIGTYSGEITDIYGQTAAVELSNGTYDVIETGTVSGYYFIDASCSGVTNSGSPTQNGVTGVQVGTDNIISCIFYNSPVPECATDLDCDDYLYCNGQETCVGGACVDGTPVSCSSNNINDIATCLNDPDNCNFTWDFRNIFESQCNEDTDSCTTGDETITHTCDVGQCGAQCDATHLCADTICHTQNGCQGNDYYTYSDVSNTCLEDCTCTNNSCGEPEISYNASACTECQTDDDCNKLNQDYCDGTAIKHDEGVCTNYACVANTTVVQDCNDGLACNGQETCSTAQCVPGTLVDCSSNNIFGVTTCGYDPDCNPYTWDYRDSFISECQEPNGICSTGDETITHTCDNQCGDCESDADCDDQNPNTADVCNLDTCQCENNAIPECTPEAIQPCETGQPGICSAGTQTCDQSGFWGSCQQTNQPVPEICDNQLDDDCDGYTDAADTDCQQCAPQATQSCEASGSGICSAGTQTCGENGFWEECVQTNQPIPEICDNDLDDDCDGYTDAADTDCQPTTGSLTICKYEDKGNIGQYEEGIDTPLAWEMTVIYPDQGTLYTATNGDTGCVTNPGLPYGEYSITEDNPENWVRSFPASSTQTATIDGETPDPEVYFLNYYQESEGGPVCGNEAVEIGEQCDDGNTANGDGCSATCQLEQTGSVCGNGVLNGGEQCDDGNNTSGDGCSATCQSEGGGGYPGGYVATQGRVLGEATTTEGMTCGIYLLQYIKYGANNDPAEVMKLQMFLNEFMGANLAVNGIYDEATLNAVNQFQLAYKEQVLRPWVQVGLHNDENVPTGYVYKTTKRWINLLKCPSLNIPMPDLLADWIGYTGKTGEVLGEETESEGYWNRRNTA